MATGLVRRAMTRLAPQSTSAARLMVVRAHASEVQAQQVEPKAKNNTSLKTNRWIMDSRDEYTKERLDTVNVNTKSNDTGTTSYLSSSPGEVNMPMTSMTGSIVGRRFYKKVTARQADDGVGWSIMLDSRTLRTPSKRPLKCPTLALATAIAAEWDYQQIDGIRPFTMPLMQLTCTALERVPLTRPKIIEFLVNKFHQDLVFCRETGDSELTKGLLERQVEKIDPLLNWVEAEFGYKPVVYTSLFGGKQGADLTNAFESLLKKTDDFELAAIDAIASAARSLTIAIGVFRGRLEIEEAIELIRLEEDLQVDKWGLVEGGHDIDIADLKVQVSSAAVFLGLSRRH